MKQLWPTILFILLLSQCTPPGQGDQAFTINDVRAAQKLIGLEFTPNEIDTMYDYLQRNRSGYDTLRTFELDYAVTPALYFDPRPLNFPVFPLQQPIYWPTPDTLTTLPDDQNELAFYTIIQLAQLLKTKQISSLELTRFFIERIKQHDPVLKATITLTEELALDQARRADAEIAAGNYRGPLHGIPYGIKDLCAVPGYKTTWGAAPYKDQYLPDTATVVKKLTEAGAVLIAKLTSGALARGDVWYGGKTVNPWDTLQGASGSSAGSASATAAGLVPFAIGTETLGSIVSPSSRCGVTGLRPTFGRVSRHGVMSLSWSMDKIGPIGRNALDCALVLEAIRGEDGMDRTVTTAPFNFKAGTNVRQLKIGYLEDLFERDTTTNGKNARLALDQFRKMGVNLLPVKLPDNYPFRIFDVILRAEAGAFFDELLRENGDDIMVQQSKRSRANSLRQSRFIPAVEYLQANRHRQRLIEEMNAIMQQYDAIISPTFGGNQLVITNLTGHPAIAFPTGLDNENHPTSLTILGNLYDEATILAITHQFQLLTEFDEQQPTGFLK